MAKTLTAVFKLKLSNPVNFNNFLNCGFPFIFSARNLYASTTLGIDNYIQSREKVKTQFKNLSDKFRLKMNEYVTDAQSKSMIFTEDLKNMIHLAESREEDISLVIKMMKKFNQQNKEMRFGSFIFGPVVMRMFYFLNEPDAALECFKTPELEGFFDQLMSYQLLLDLLYENHKYNEVVETFELIKSKQIQGTKYPKNIVVLTMAACYKQNTPKSLEYALSLWTELNNVGHLPMRRATTFCANLALNQNKPDAALEIISSVKKQNYMTVRSIKAAALAEIGRTEEVLSILKSILEIDDPNDNKHTFPKDIIERIRTVFEKQENPTLKNEFLRVEKILREQNQISDTTLDITLCSEITSPPVLPMKDRRTIPRYEYNNDQRSNKYRVYNQRPGLTEMN